MKELIKVVLGNIIYVLYKIGILKNRIKVASIDETLDELIKTEKSLVRFGDGEIVMIYGRPIILQKESPDLSERLKKIIHYDNDDLLVGIPEIFNDLSQYSRRSRRFWKIHLLSFRKVYEKYCNLEKRYYNAFLSRMYYNYQDKKDCGRWLEKFKNVWKGKDIVFVEGTGTHNGVGNDLFSDASSIERILCPSCNAFQVYDLIIEECMKLQKNKLILLSLGSTAKVLATDLFDAGYRVIDIGNLDMEYEWYLRKADSKTEIEKHKIIGKEANQKAGYMEYLQQIIANTELS